MNMDLITFERTVYSTLDMFGDVGGLQAALLIILGSVYGIFTTNEFENWLVTNLFRAEKPEGSKFNEAFKFKETGQEIKQNKLSCTRLLFSKCLRPNKYERIFLLARNKMGKEIDIVHFIQARRQLKKLYKLSFLLSYLVLSLQPTLFKQASSNVNST